MAVMSLSTTAFAAPVDVITNGGFENGLNGWTGVNTELFGAPLTCASPFSSQSNGSTTCASLMDPVYGSYAAYGSLTLGGASDARWFLVQSVVVPVGFTSVELSFVSAARSIPTSINTTAIWGARLYDGSFGDGNVIMVGEYSSMMPATFSWGDTFWDVTGDLQSRQGQTVTVAMFVGAVSFSGYPMTSVAGLDQVALTFEMPDEAGVPEPGTAGLLSLAGVGAILMRRRRACRAASA